MTRFLSLLLLPLLLLSGCSSFTDDLSDSYGMLKESINGVVERPVDPVKEEKKKLPVYDGTCPPAMIRPDLSYLADFQDPAKTADGDKVSEITMAGVANTCRLENNNLLVQVDITLTGKTGPKARIKPNDQPNFAYPYFIAVTDNNGTVVSKEIFAATVSYGRSQNETSQVETIFQSMPFPDAAAGRTYSVVVGFQLTPEQLAYNQSKGITAAAVTTSTTAAPAPIQPPAPPPMFDGPRAQPLPRPAAVPAPY